MELLNEKERADISLRREVSETSDNYEIHKRRYRKVRTGCFNCKKRRVKCSEEKPNCSACARRGVSCNYPPLVHNKVAVSPVPSTSPSTQSVTILTSTSNLTTTDHPCSQQHGPFTSSTSFAPASIASPAPSRSDVLFNLHDMTLLHHWTASTSQQVAKDKEIRNFWQNTATSVALQHLYVL
ncbi:hypothetical protein QWA68_015342 [Fusarium oxysporum]|nr:hypothetical protein QWA68_015342 [Fusarium oxysporum]